MASSVESGTACAVDTGPELVELISDVGHLSVTWDEVGEKWCTAEVSKWRGGNCMEVVKSSCTDCVISHCKTRKHGSNEQPMDPQFPYSIEKAHTRVENRQKQWRRLIVRCCNHIQACKMPLVRTRKTDRKGSPCEVHVTSPCSACLCIFPRVP